MGTRTSGRLDGTWYRVSLPTPMPCTSVFSSFHFRTLALMIDYGEKSKNPSFSTSLTVITPLLPARPSAHHRQCVCTGLEYSSKPLPRASRTSVRYQRPLPPQCLLQDDQPIHRPRHPREAEIQPELRQRRVFRGEYAAQGELGRG